MMKPSEKQIVSPVSPQFGAWKKVKLEEVAESIQTGPFGSQLHQSDYSIEGTPVIMPKDIIEGKVSTETIARVEELHVTRLARHKVKEGEIVYSRRGDVGKCAYITKKQEGWLCGTGCLKVTINKNEASPKFIFYQLQKKSVIGWIEKHAKGATMANLNTSILSDVPLELPSISIQDSIATTLSRYDKLIANYQRQIKLLEEAAQRLYKEWFVDLHFPGHENVKVIDGVPEGWEKCELGDIATFKRGKTITKNNIKEGNVPVVAGGLNPAYFHDTANTKAPVITVSGSGANAGYTRLYHTDVWASDCSYIDQSTSESIYFVYCFLKVNKVYLDNLQKGAAQPHVYAKDINQMPILKPSQGILDAFNNLVKLYFNTIGNLEHQITLLTESRDRFLPKLMSGEIELKI